HDAKGRPSTVYTSPRSRQGTLHFAKSQFHIELYQLPAPDFQVPAGSTRVVLYASQPLARLSGEDRTRACYQHCCLCQLSGDMMTNTSLRKRFAIEDHNASQASRIIAETVKANLIRQFTQEAGNRYRRYVPFWA